MILGPYRRHRCEQSTLALKVLANSTDLSILIWMFSEMLLKWLIFSPFELIRVSTLFIKLNLKFWLKITVRYVCDDRSRVAFSVKQWKIIKSYNFCASLFNLFQAVNSAFEIQFECRSNCPRVNAQKTKLMAFPRKYRVLYLTFFLTRAYFVNINT